jgi:hypothetical protein
MSSQSKLSSSIVKKESTKKQQTSCDRSSEITKRSGTNVINPIPNMKHYYKTIEEDD